LPWNHTLQLRYSDLDYLGHVTAAAHLTHFEEARTAWLAAAWKTAHPAYVVARQELRYLREVLLEDGPLTISVVPVRLGTSSFDVEESLVTASGECKTRSRATLVSWDLLERKATSMSDVQRSALEARLAAPSGSWPAGPQQ
jgi:acyl-CoA thioester hydrolase